ncbi:MAG: hypothetical protein Alpg2KO_00810 [Alphaproteobacteria bacterium]
MLADTYTESAIIPSDKLYIGTVYVLFDGDISYQHDVMKARHVLSEIVQDTPFKPKKFSVYIRDFALYDDMEGKGRLLSKKAIEIKGEQYAITNIRPGSIEIEFIHLVDIGWKFVQGVGTLASCWQGFSLLKHHMKSDLQKKMDEQQKARDEKTARELQILQFRTEYRRWESLKRDLIDRSKKD